MKKLVSMAVPNPREGREFESRPDRIEAQAFTDVWAFLFCILNE
jgi:hypothetical protein